MRKNNNFIFLFVTACLLLFSCGEENKINEKNPKIFRYNIHEGFTSMDPAFARNQSNIWVINQLYNGLVELDLDMKVVPSIAERWDISNDGKTYTFFLRRNVYFHEHELFSTSTQKDEYLGNTREVTAHDFVYSFKRILDAKVASTGAWIFNDKVLKNEGAISDTCFKAIDNFTFKIYLEEPFPAFLEILTMPYAFVVPQEVVAHYEKDFRDHPIGTGPFKMKHFEEESVLILNKNKLYWKKDNKGNRLPYIDAAKISFVNDKTAAFLSFTNGDLDFFSGLDENGMDIILNRNGVIKEKYKGKFKIEKMAYLNTEYLGFLLDEENPLSANHVFQNKKVRQAINYAINREELIDYIRNGRGYPARSGIIPKALPAYNEQEVVGYTYNPDKALTLLSEAGFPNGKGLPVLKLYTQPNSQYHEMGELIQKNCEEIGVKIELFITPFATHQEMVDNSKVNFFRGSWLGDYPDAENYLTLFYSKNFAPSGPNKTHFKNKRFDELYEKAIGITETEERWELYREMDKIIIEEAPVVVLYYDDEVRFTQHYVKGIKADPMNSLKLERVDIEL